MSERRGRCACGGVTFTANVTADSLGACHCGTCRRINGGPFVCVEASGLRFTGGAPVGIFNSSDWAERSFCKRCGSSLAYHLKGTNKAFVGAYLFDPPLNLPLGGEVFIDEKPTDYAFAGETHKMTGPEVFAMFQGQG